MAEVAGAFGAQEIDYAGRRRVILRRPGKQIVDRHEESLPDRRRDRELGTQTCELGLGRRTVDASGVADTRPTSTRTTSSPMSRGASRPRKTCLAAKRAWACPTPRRYSRPQMLNDLPYDHGQSQGSLSFRVIPIITILR